MNTNKIAKIITVLLVAYVVIFAGTYILAAGSAWFVSMNSSYWLITNWDSGARLAFLLTYLMFSTLFSIFFLESN